MLCSEQDTLNVKFGFNLYRLSGHHKIKFDSVVENTLTKTTHMGKTFGVRGQIIEVFDRNIGSVYVYFSHQPKKQASPRG